MKSIHIVTAAFTLITFLMPTAMAAQLSKPVLDTKTAQAIIDGCITRSQKEGWSMSVAIVDDGGNLKYFTRMDGAPLLSIKIAHLKADTSAGLPFPTRKFREIARNAALGLDLIPETTGVAGGLPIKTASGQWLGAVGVSGGSEDQDELCAQAGLDAARDGLK